MVAQQTATRSTARTRKPEPPVTVRPVDVRAGLYSCAGSLGHPCERGVERGSFDRFRERCGSVVLVG